MIIGIGVDVVGISRFEDLMKRSPGVIGRVLTESEQRDTDGRMRASESLAARFAAKEAIAKVLGSPGSLQWHDCHVATSESGQPSILLTGTVEAAAQAAGIAKWHLSLTHDAGIATAFVVAESG